MSTPRAVSRVKGLASKRRRGAHHCDLPAFAPINRAAAAKSLGRKSRRPIAGDARSAVRYWIVKGNEKRNDLDDMLSPGTTEPWITKKPPRAWGKGDRVFFWKSSPSLRLVGLGTLDRIGAEKVEEGNTLFYLKYLTESLGKEGVTIEALRKDPIVFEASFLKAGAAGTVFPLTEVQAKRLGEILSKKDIAFKEVLSTWFQPAKDESAKPSTETGSPLMTRLGPEWSRPYKIVTVMQWLGLALPKDRLSWKQFGEILTALHSIGAEMMLKDGDRILSKADISPGIQARVRLRLRGAAVESPTSPNGAPQFPKALLSLTLNNESEVENFFITPLLGSLGYSSGDLSMRHKVFIQQGVAKVPKRADIVVFAGSDRENKSSLIVVEAKSPGLSLKRDHEHQALSYLVHLKTPYCIVTNGKELRVFDNNILCFRSEVQGLEKKWPAFYALLNRATVIAKKAALREQIASV